MTSLHDTVLPPDRRITVLISGGGTNLQALLDAASTSRLPSAHIIHVLSSRSNAHGLTRASTHTPPIPTSVCALKTFLSRNPGSTRAHYDAEVARQVLETRPDLVVLAGWMHILSDSFLDILNGVRPPPSAPALPPPDAATLPTHPGQLPSTLQTSPGLPLPQSFPIPCINLHPALPGAFDGARAIERAFEAFQRGEVEKTGVMVHRVVREVDRGQPLVVRDVDMREEDTLEQLQARIHETEHEVIVEGARLALQEKEKTR